MREERKGKKREENRGRRKGAEKTHETGKARKMNAK